MNHNDGADKACRESHDVVQQCCKRASLIEIADLERLREILAEIVRRPAWSALPSPIIASIE